MKVRFEQAGGVTGLVKGCEVEVAALSEAAWAALSHLPRRAAPSPVMVRHAIQ